MKRVAIITNVPSPYRVDFFYFLQTHYKDYDFQIIYYCNDNMARQWKADEDRMLNSHFVPSKTIRIKKRFDDHFISFPVKVGKTLSDINPDVVVAMEYSPAILQAMRWCKKHRVKYVSWTDGTINSEKNIGKLQRMSRKYIFKRADVFIGSSSASQANQLSYGADKKHCHISLLTVDLDKYILPPKTEYSNRLICVGSLIERKGVDLLLKALAACENKAVELDLVGDGIEKDNLKAMARELGIEDRVHFLGFLPTEEVRRMYGEAGAFVLPTREDCFGLVLIEAMCASLPIISSKYSDGAFETVTEGVNGHIIDPYNAGEFAKAIDDMFADKNKCEQFGKASFDMKEKFRFENVSKGYIEAIKDALGE